MCSIVLEAFMLFLKYKNKNLKCAEEKKKIHPQTGTLLVTGNKIFTSALDITITAEGIQGFLFLCKGLTCFWESATVASPVPRPTGPGCGDEGTDLCVIKPHFSVTPFSKYPKDELRSWCACATHNANVDTLTVFLYQPV